MSAIQGKNILAHKDNVCVCVGGGVGSCWLDGRVHHSNPVLLPYHFLPGMVLCYCVLPGFQMEPVCSISEGSMSSQSRWWWLQGHTSFVPNTANVILGCHRSPLNDTWKDNKCQVVPYFGISERWVPNPKLLGTFRVPMVWCLYDVFCISHNHNSNVF